MFLNKSGRRSFFKKATLATVASVGSLELFAKDPSKKRINITKEDVILFQGDSITDAGRKKDNKDANSTSALGSGYALLATAALLKQEAGKDLKIFNRGISGNKVYQLAERWDADCLDIKPTVLSILIGVNDFWHKFNGAYAGTTEKYITDFKALLDRTKEKLPNVQLIIGEPFAVNNVKAVTDKWYPEFDEYRAAAKDIAESYGAVFIPYQSIFDKAQKTAPGAYWTGDGVHPSLAGCELMAQAWLDAVKL